MNLIAQTNSLYMPLADKSVQCCVTSPPYYGLRDYGTAKWEGGDTNCLHINGTLQSNKTTLHPGTNQNDKRNFTGMPYKYVCLKCGAIRIDSQIGLEQSPDEYVQKLVSVFREVKRVLKDDGTLWLNLGDSYGGSGQGTSYDGYSRGPNSVDSRPLEMRPPTGHTKGKWHKQLLGIPWRVAFALQADGWYLRSDIIWHKPNPMPESVKDRPTKAHEYIFLMTKNDRYYYDSDAIKELLAAVTLNDKRVGVDISKGGIKDYASAGVQNPSDVRARIFNNLNGKRNKRTVWTVTTKPYRGAHFATFPPDLIEPCILAGCPEGGVVLDPFVGSGTTVMVANRNSRRGVGFDLSWKYLYENAKVRIASV